MNNLYKVFAGGSDARWGVLDGGLEIHEFCLAPNPRLAAKIARNVLMETFPRKRFKLFTVVQMTLPVTGVGLVYVPDVKGTTVRFK